MTALAFTSLKPLKKSHLPISCRLYRWRYHRPFLLPGVEDAGALIIVDAAELNAPPGTVRVFRGEEIEQQMSGRKRTVHEVAISDLLSAAALRGTCPAERALVAIQPCSTDWGLELTPAVKAAIPAACAAVTELTRRYQDEA